nr:hypothetical protein [Demequina sp. TTPB684]
MGILTTEHGAGALAQALVASRSTVTVISALAPYHLTHIAHSHEHVDGVLALADLVEATKKPPVPSERSGPGPSDWLLADVARLLQAEGLAVRLRYGVGGQAIPMVVGGTRDRGYSIAVVTDEPPSGPRGSVRDRLRWQYRHLEALGWKVVPLWTIDVFMDPVAAAAQVKRALTGGDVEETSVAEVGTESQIEAEVEAAPEVAVQVADRTGPDIDAAEPTLFDDATLWGDALDTADEAEDDEAAVDEPTDDEADDDESDDEADDDESDDEADEPADEADDDDTAEGELDDADEPDSDLDGDESGSDEDHPSEEDTDPEPAVVEPSRVGVDRPLIPTRAWEDEDAAWGDAGASRDDEIKRDRPPHW